MRLNVRESGAGDKIAVLIHGFNCDSGDWWELTPTLLDLGYRVQALDLRGHGDSPRAESYNISDYGDDVVETVAMNPEIIIGHSLGGRVTGEVVDRLRPNRAIYLDPPWTAVSEEDRISLFPPLDEIPTMSDDQLRATLRRDFPAWSDRAVEVDIASWRKWDPATAADISGAIVDGMPSEPKVPSLVVVADPSIVCDGPAQAEATRRGFDVRVAPGLTHSLFRDDYAVFLSTLDGWL